MLENIYVTIVIVIVLMMLDFFLTMQGLKSYKQKYATFVLFESYELNPSFKDSINKQRYDSKHFLSVLLVVVLLYIFHYLSFQSIFWFTPISFYFLQGMIFSMFICINAKHIQNVITFNAVNKNPSILSGKLKQSTLFSLEASKAQFFALFLILLILSLFSPNAFFFGFASGPLVLLFKSHLWMKKKPA
ncbi:hypothetical protein HYW21_01680 [Candidatus Woesearchaeota archaeon]|nr:hypothetical protein [Candidatus Woesearchaeota archaeon]